MTRYMRGIQAAGLGGDRNGMPAGGGYRWRNTPGWNPAALAVVERSNNGNRPLDPIPCGTWQGYNRHINQDQEPCRPCRNAYREYRRAKYQASKKAAS